MRLVLSAVLFVWSLSVFAGARPSHTEYLHGTGMLVDARGNAERYLASLVVKKKSETKYVLNYDLQFTNRNVHFNLAFVHDSVDDSFFSVYLHGADGYHLAGHGYSWGRKAHFFYTTPDGTNVENTVHRNRRTGEVMSMGSKSHGGRVKGIWKEAMHRINH